jgi:hypothetical protein
MKRRWTPEEDEIIRADFADYIDVRVTAAKIGRDTGTLRQRIYQFHLKRDQGITRLLRWCPEHLKPLLKTRGVDAFREVYDREQQQIREAESEAGPEAKSAEENEEITRRVMEIDSSLERREKMMAMRAIGLTLQEIGDRFGLSRERVRQLTDLDFAPYKPRTGSVKNLSSINEKLKAKLAANRRRMQEKTISDLLELWNFADSKTRADFLMKAKASK